MPAAPLPTGDAERLAALRSYQVLDTRAEEAFDRLVALAARLTGTPSAAISLIDADRQWFKARVGIEAEAIPREQSFCAYAILTPQQPLVVPDATADARFADNPLVTAANGLRFYAGVPLVNPEGHALGALCVADDKPRGLSPEQLDALVTLAGAVASTLELRRAMRRAHQLALTDALTGLANRPALLDALDRVITRLGAAAEPFTLIHLDLDGFRRVNDLHGQITGDQALREAGAAMAGALPEEALAARLGGDEFAVLLPGAASGAAMAERLRLAVNKRLDARRWPVTASVGAATFHVAPEDMEEALSVADELLARAKAAGRNRSIHFNYRFRPGAAA
jgi:diguanylate cyclase (GGDEF)-like protein